MTSSSSVGRRRVRHEDAIQRQVVEFLARALPGRGVCEWFHVPNGAHMTKAQRGIFRSLGRRPGVPDFVFDLEGRIFYVEMKRPDGGRLSPEQKAFRDHAIERGSPWFLCTSVDDVQVALEHMGVPLRTKIAGVRYSPAWASALMGRTT